MATEQELIDERSSIDTQIAVLGGRQGLRGRREAVRITEQNIAKIEDKLKNQPNNEILQIELANEDRILKENQAEIARLEGELAPLRQRRGEIENELFDIEARRRGIFQQQNSAKGQTAESQIQNTTTSPQPEKLTTEEKNRVDAAKSGALSADLNQSQNSQPLNLINGSNPKSEANFNSTTTNTPNDSVIGKNVTGKKSDYSIEVVGTVPENILHRYTSYTYRLTLFFLTSQDYNNLAASPSTFKPKYALISSAGGYATSLNSLVAEETKTGRANYDQTLRHPDFQTDFFIDNLSMQTIVGLNAKTKASNAVDITFTITEPYGLSLLDRLLSACETSDDATVNYMSQPYLLQIDLLASPTDDELGRTQNTNNVITSKKIAIKLIEMKIKPNASGTTYSVRAMPYNHTAFDTSAASLPIPINVEANTVGEFFSANDSIAQQISGQIQAEEDRIEGEVDKWINENYRKAGRKPSPQEIANFRASLKQAVEYNTKSLPAAYNTYNESISKKKNLAQQVPTKIAFNIPDNAISKSPIVNIETSSSGDTRMEPGSNSFGKPDKAFKKTQNFSLNAGTSIIDVIDMIISRSDYVKNQIKTKGSEQNITESEATYVDENERAENKKKPENLKWYKVLPTVALNDFDTSTNTYSRTILYTILPYKAANSYHPNFARVNSSTVADSIVRTYDFLYTGKNQDIIKFDVDFDTSFFTLVTTKGEQVNRLSNNAKSDKNEQDVNQAAFAAQAGNITNSVIETRFTGSNKAAVGTTKANDPDEQVIADMKSSLYTRQRGDNLNVKLQIVGDPDFIKQDDIFINAGSFDEYEKFITSRLANNSTRPIAEDGQILFDAEQVYVRVNVKNAVDIDDSIGIVNKQDLLKNGRRTNGTFSGIYKVLTVQSEFSRGTFTQTLDLIRIPDALDPPKKPATNDNPNQAASPTSIEKLDKDAEAKRNIFANPTIPQTTIPTPPLQTPGQPSDVTQIKNPLTFAQAFAQARKDFGNKPGGSFEWRGKLYQTNYQNEPYVANPTPVYPGANE